MSYCHILIYLIYIYNYIYISHRKNWHCNDCTYNWSTIKCPTYSGPAWGSEHLDSWAKNQRGTNTSNTWNLLKSPKYIQILHLVSSGIIWVSIHILSTSIHPPGLPGLAALFRYNFNVCSQAAGAKPSKEAKPNWQQNPANETFIFVILEVLRPNRNHSREISAEIPKVTVALLHDVACQFSEMPHNQQEESGEQSKNNLSNYSQHCSWYLNVFAKLCSLNSIGRLWVECEVVYIGSCCPSCGGGEMEHSIHLPCASRNYNKMMYDDVSWCKMYGDVYALM